ncbi:MAG TPA: 30S ribosomal protein S2 [Alphaproteobacteria bacterium]|nr:30S ribosomal protein S2 [Alphaproteobacteria bacterium]
MALPQFTMTDLLGAGVHFGHRAFRWNPKLKSYIYGERNGIHIIDLQQTLPAIYTALSAIEAAVARGGRVLFVGTRKQAQGVVREAAERCGMYFVNHRWLGGTLTNWKTISKSIKRLRDLEQLFKDSAEAQARIAEAQAAATPENPFNRDSIKDPMAHYVKKERLMLERERENLHRVLGGISSMAGLPDVVVVMSVHQDKIAVDEANRLGIPVVGIVDTNASDEGVDYVIPGNDDSVRALNLYARLCADAAISGIAMQASLHQPGGNAAGAEGASRGARKGPVTVSLSKKAREVAKADDKAADAAEAAPAAEAPKA